MQFANIHITYIYSVTGCKYGKTPALSSRYLIAQGRALSRVSYMLACYSPSRHNTGKWKKWNNEAFYQSELDAADVSSGIFDVLAGGKNRLSSAVCTNYCPVLMLFVGALK